MFHDGRSSQHFVKIPQEPDSDADVEENLTEGVVACPANASRYHPFEGSNNPVAQVTLQCNVDVKYLAPGISAG